MEYLLLWIVFSFAAASMAKSKGRSIPLWFVLGLFIGPFAVLIIALMKPTETGDKSYQ